VVEIIKVTPPLRAEPVFNEFGFFSLRWAEYFEETAVSINSVQENESVFESLNPGAAAQGQQAKQIDNLELISTINQNSAAIASLNKKIKDLELLVSLAPNLSGFAKQLTVIAVSADYTSVGNEIIICTNTIPITITLSATANNLDEVHVKRQNTGLVTVAGAIDGSPSLVIVFQYDSPSLIYTTDAGEYSII